MKRVLILFLVVISLFGLTASSHAQTGAGYDLSWWTIDSGGGQNVSGGTYSLSATIGQPDASAGGGSGYTLSGGFWGRVGSVLLSIFLPLTIR